MIKPQNIKILIIDDNAAIHDDFKKILLSSTSTELDTLKQALFGDSEVKAVSSNYIIESAFQGEEGIAKVKQAKEEGLPFAIAFVDVRMPPGIDGVETIIGLWQVDATIQTVICTAYSDYSWTTISQKLGSTDRLLILKKPFDNIEVLQFAATLTQKYLLNVEVHNQLQTLESLVNDRTQQLEQTLTKLEYNTTHDLLTKLPNRTLFRDRVLQAIKRSKISHAPFSILYLDINRFKAINDSLGHQIGDQLLIEVAARLRQAITKQDTVARLGGDEFIIILTCPDIEKCTIDAMHIITAELLKPFAVADTSLTLSPNIGISIYPKDGEDFDTLINAAAVALYQAKKTPGNYFKFYNENMNSQILEKLQLENELRIALETNTFSLHYQPLYDLKLKKTTGNEALLRWEHPKLGFIPPLKFISIAEEAGLIIPLGYWVLKTACEQNAKWNKNNYALTVAVNVSSIQFQEPDFVERVATILREANLPAHLLELELTESILIENNEEIIGKLRLLKKLGIKLSIDDFGTGFSSLSYLTQFPVDKIKIDRSFVIKYSAHHKDQALILAIIAMGHALQLKVLAEGVETLDQLNFLQTAGCDDIQGYIIAKPTDHQSVEKFFNHNFFS